MSCFIITFCPLRYFLVLFNKTTFVHSGRNYPLRNLLDSLKETTFCSLRIKCNYSLRIATQLSTQDTVFGQYIPLRTILPINLSPHRIMHKCRKTFNSHRKSFYSAILIGVNKQFKVHFIFCLHSSRTRPQIVVLD